MMDWIAKKLFKNTYNGKPDVILTLAIIYFVVFIIRTIITGLVIHTSWMTWTFEMPSIGEVVGLISLLFTYAVKRHTDVMEGRYVGKD